MTRILIPTAILVMCLACGDMRTSIAWLRLNLSPIRKPIINLSPPIINKIVIPDHVRAGTRRIKLEAVAEDPDGNTLTYNWEVPAGKLLYNKSMSIAIWTAPIDLGVVTINLTVNDGIHEKLSISGNQSHSRLNRARKGSRRHKVARQTLRSD